LGVEQKPAHCPRKNRADQRSPFKAAGQLATDAKKAGQNAFFACVKEGISGKTGLVKLEVIGGIKIVIDGATQL